MGYDAKYFTCGTKEEAAEHGCAYFSCGEQCLSVRMVREPDGKSPGLALVLYGETPQDRQNVQNMSGRARLFYEDDGVFAELYPSLGKGAPLDREDAAKYIQRKNIDRIDKTELVRVLERGFGRARVGPKQEENVLNQDAFVRISKDEMEAAATLLPPDEGGALLDMERLEAQMKQAGVVNGHMQFAMRALISEQRYDKSYIIARGSKPQDGENGKIILHFRTNLTAAPKVIDEKRDRVDYRSLDLFEPVAEGQHLVTRALATPGTPGVTVTGRELKPKPGREAVIPRGKNIYYSEDKTQIFAQTSGMVTYERGSINVMNVYVVKGDCDMSTGNIDFEGNVEVRGNVISGMTVKAAGNIIINGVVEGAAIIAGGDILLARGIQGMDRGELRAGGDITAQFIERCHVTAGGSVTADVIIHSQVAVSGVLTVRGKRGSIVGGSIKVAKEVIAVTIGSQANTGTEIEVGVLPATRDRLNQLKIEIKRIMDELDKLEKLDAYLSKAAQLDEARTKLYNSIGESRMLNSQLLQECSEEMSRLVAEVETATQGKVHVLDTVFPGVRISISSARMKVEDPIPYASFRFSGGEISYIPCEVSRH